MRRWEQWPATGRWHKKTASHVFLSGGLLFHAMIFATSAVAGRFMMAYEAIPRKLMDPTLTKS